MYMFTHGVHSVNTQTTSVYSIHTGQALEFIEIY